MNFLRKHFLFAALCCIIIMPSLSGCSEKSAGTGDVLCTFYPVYLAAINIVPDADVRLLTQPAGCLHDYQLTPRERGAFEGAGFILAAGAGNEGFLGGLEDYPAVRDCSEGIELLRDGDEVNGHYWLLPENFLKMSRNAERHLKAAGFETGGDEFFADLERLAEETPDLSGEREYIVFHEAFEYWREIGLNITAAVEGEPGEELSPRALAELPVNERTVIIADAAYIPAGAKVLGRNAPLLTFPALTSGPLGEPDYYQKSVREYFKCTDIA